MNPNRRGNSVEDDVPPDVWNRRCGLNRCYNT
jgi:hypothetical protein